MSSLTLDRTPRVEPPSTMERIWSRRYAAWSLAGGVAGAAALLSAWLTPRGPVTTMQALASIALALGVGLVAGVLAGTRWSMLVTPAVFMVVFELARVGTAGPTVDGISMTMLGVFALVVGRMVHGLVVLVPMVVGVGYGVWVASQLGHPTARRPGVPGRVVIGVMSLGILALAAALARPASTAPILGTDGEPLPGSITEFATVQIGGVDQVMMIRGLDVGNPVLLHLSGGPGGTDIGAMRADTSLEEHFVVVTWDQRGTGKSYATSLDPVEDLTLDQAIADTLAVTDYLRHRFAQDRIYLTANSWGTIPSVRAVQQHPERFHAYVGTGQMVNNAATDRMFYEDALAWAARTGQDGLADQIRSAGPPPYDDLLQYQHTVSYEHQWNAYPGVDDLYEMPFNVFVPEYALIEQVNALRGMFDVNWFVYPQLQDYDFRRDATRLQVPVYMVIGQYEARGRAEPAREWFELLQAPSKQMVVFENSGHRPSFEQPDRFTALMIEVVEATGGEQSPA